MDEKDKDAPRWTHLYRAVALGGKVDELSTRELLRMIGHALMRGEQPPIDIAQWLGIALLAIGKGADANVALRLKARRGRPDRVNWEEVFERYHALYLGGVAHTTACAQIAADMSADGIEVDERTIRNSYEKNLRWTYETFPRHVLESVSEDTVFQIVCVVREARGMFQPILDAAPARDQDRNK